MKDLLDRFGGCIVFLLKCGLIGVSFATMGSQYESRKASGKTDGRMNLPRWRRFSFHYARAPPRLYVQTTRPKIRWRNERCALTREQSMVLDWASKRSWDPTNIEQTSILVAYSS